MGMQEAVVSLTSGPLWASLINACLDVIDGHDHTAGKGIAIPTSALNINADLSLNAFNLQGIRGLRLNNQAATLTGATDNRIIYSKNGELAYRDAVGNEVIITSAGSVNAAAGGWTGLSAPASASFSSGTGVFALLKDTSKSGKLSISDIAISEFNNATANPITIKSPAAVSASYSITLPASVPPSKLPMFMSSGGVLSTSGIMLLDDGSVSAPSHSFGSDTNTGIYRSASGAMSFTCAGAQSVRMVANKLQVSASVISAATPHFAFIEEISTGMYLSGTGELGFAALGATTLTISSAVATLSSALLAIPRARAGSGTAGNPTFGFTGATDTGMYLIGAGNLGLSAAGAQMISLTATTANIALSGTTNVNNINAAAATANSLNLGSGGAFTTKIFSGVLTAGSSATLTVGGTIVGIFGYTDHVNAGNSYIAMVTTDTTVGVAAPGCRFDISSSISSAVVTNTNGSSSSAYKVVVFYQ